MPTAGSAVPIPNVLAVVHCPLQVHVQTSSGDDQHGLIQLNGLPEPQSIPAPNKIALENQAIESKASLSHEASFLSITDDGRLWHWVINEEDCNGEPVYSNGVKKFLLSLEIGSTPRAEAESNSSADGGTQLVNSSSNGVYSEPIFKVCPWTSQS